MSVDAGKLLAFNKSLSPRGSSGVASARPSNNSVDDSAITGELLLSSASKVSQEQLDALLDDLQTRITRLMKQKDMLERRIRELKEKAGSESKKAMYGSHQLQQSLEEALAEVDTELMLRRRRQLGIFQHLKKKALKKRAFNIGKTQEHWHCRTLPSFRVRPVPDGGTDSQNVSDVHSCVQDFNTVDQEKLLPARVCGHTVSTYPTLTLPDGSKRRQGDPVCDRFWIQLLQNRYIATVADGCNWGIQPATAAHVGTIQFIRYFREAQHNKVNDTLKAGRYLLRALSAAHDSIVKNKPGEDELSEAGTSTMLGGLLLELDHSDAEPHSARANSSESPAVLRRRRATHASASASPDAAKARKKSSRSKSRSHSKHGSVLLNQPGTARDDSARSSVPALALHSTAFQKPRSLSLPTAQAPPSPRRLAELRRPPPAPSSSSSGEEDNGRTGPNTDDNDDDDDGTAEVDGVAACDDDDDDEAEERRSQDGGASASTTPRSTQSTERSSKGKRTSRLNSFMRPSYPRTRWGFVCASVGDCKAFHWSKSTNTVTDISSGNRMNVDNAKDCGGRLGPYLEGGKPDLRNLCTFYQPCEDGDLLFLCSDGVHDCLDPETLGKTPVEVGLTGYERWKDVDYDTAEDVKNRFRCEWVEALIKDFQKKLVEVSPKNLTRAIIHHCVSTTSLTREFMEQNPSLDEPDDYKLYPGKMDHTTCLCFRVGTPVALMPGYRQRK